MRTGVREIVDGSQYDGFFPKPEGETIIIKKVADIPDTVQLMKKVIAETLEDTRRIARQLRASTVYETCRNVWNFTFQHLQYKRDRPGREEVRRPARAWRDGQKKGGAGGVDCDCMTVFIGSILRNLKIPFKIRLTGYETQETEIDENNFSHVYPVAVPENREVIMDCVVHQFDYEVPYKQKKDVNMELHYLNGIDEGDFYPEDASANILGELFGDEFSPDELGLLLAGTDLEGLEGKTARKARRVEKKQIRQSTPLKDRLKSTLQKINKVNPVTAALRAGILAALKLNVMNIAGKLRFAYLSQQQAANNNMNMSKYGQLQDIRKRVEKIFTGAGGKLENLKEAILKGKGNKDRKVSLNGLEGIDAHSVDDYQQLDQILGLETYQDEFSSGGIGEIGSLGVITASAAIASASGVIGTLYSMLKKLGELFKKGSPQNQTELTQEQETQKEDTTRIFSKDGIAQYIKLNPKPLQPLDTGVRTPDAPLPLTIPSQSSGNNLPEEIEAEITAEENTPAIKGEAAADTTADTTKTGDTSTKPGIMDWVKEHPGYTALIATGLVGLGLGIVYLVKSSKKKSAGASLSGFKSTKKRKSTKKKGKSKAKGSAKTPASRYIQKLELL